MTQRDVEKLSDPAENPQLQGPPLGIPSGTWNFSAPPHVEFFQKALGQKWACITGRVRERPESRLRLARCLATPALEP